MSTVFSNVVNILKDNGYVVNTQPQEKQMMFDNMELIVLVTDLDVEVESTTTYLQDVECEVILQITSSEDLLTAIPSIMKLIESNIGFVHGFKFLKPDVELMGTMYSVGIKFSYKETITIE